jgi:hypothetical protein
VYFSFAKRRSGHAKVESSAKRQKYHTRANIAASSHRAVCRMAL